MSPAPRVSIVIPVFNDEATIAAALESCLAQTLVEVEIVCVDDASTDETKDVIERYQARDSRIRLIRQERNLSAFQARRAGILAAKADHVLFLDGDDELTAEAAKTALRAAETREADLLGFGIEVISPSGGVVGGYQSRLAPKHEVLNGQEVLDGLFPVDQPAQGQLWRYLFRTQLLRDAYELLPEDLALPRVNDLPLMFLVAALASRYSSVPDRLYRYHFGRGGSGQAVETLKQVQFYAEAIRSIDSIAPAVRSIARTSSNAAVLLDSYESVRQSIVGYVCSYLLKHTRTDLTPEMLDHLHACTSATDLIISSARFYPQSLRALKLHSAPVGLGKTPVRNVLLTTRALTTGGVSGVLLAQAAFLMQSGYRVTIVARRYGSDRKAVPDGATFIEMVGRGLPERLMEWAEICRIHEIDVVIDHQVLYSRDWPEYALVARSLDIANIGWLHNFVGRPIYDLNGLHALLKDNASLLETLVSLSPLDVAFWKLRGVPDAVYVPNPPSPMLLESVGESEPKHLAPRRVELIWWGRLDEHTKQMTQLIDVADELRRLSVDFHLTVIGPDWDGWTADRFNDAVRRRGLDGYMEAVGERRGQQLTEAIDGADAFVSTSVIEGYQLTIAEAQARGLPVFMYELPWLTLVQDNDGIVAVPQGNAAELARQIATVVRSPERYAELSTASIVAARRELSHDFGRLYEQVITGALPAAFSPQPTLDDARQLLDLMVFFAERNAGLRAEVAELQKGKSKSAGSTPKSSAAPPELTLAQRAWRKATPFGRTLLQLFPGLRRFAHHAKKSLIS
jgi:glycosyltransferase involved in cell wall biosynthesis